MQAVFDILAAHPEANAFGLFAAVLGAVWPIFKTREQMLWCQAIIHAAMATHFFLLGAPVGSLMNALGLGQTLAAIPLGTRPGFKKVYIAYLPIIAAGMAYTWNGYESLLPALALTILSLARYQTNVMRFRVMILGTILSWLAYDMIVMSIPGLVLDAGSLAMSIAMIRRERRLRLAERVLQEG